MIPGHEIEVGRESARSLLLFAIGEIALASGKTHENVTFIGAATSIVAMLWYSVPTVTALLIGAGIVFGGIWLSPDLDCRRSLPHRRWGILDVLWRPYTLLGHRNVLSHGWLIGSFLRIVYIALWIFPFILWFGMPPEWMWSPIWYVMLGIVFGGESHLLTDLLTTGDNDTSKHWL